MTRNYKRKFLFSLIITSLIIFIILNSMFGENGIVKNSQIQNTIGVKEGILKEKEKEIKTLSLEVDLINSPQHIVTVMNKIGYAPSGQSSYIFPYKPTPSEPPKLIESDNKNGTLLTPFHLCMISLGISFVLHALAFSLWYKRGHRKR